ncbi:MAG: carboxylesterase/lipase family protein, partial [Planctomycetota bacterium]
ARLPVMVWIHGGGHTTGSGAMSYYDGTRLAREGVVVVTINYRLGPFGYFAHPLLSAESERGVSGNYGLLDQVAALKWVQRNIAALGGDPQCVTVFGESAGAVSVCRLMVCPLAEGLFHRAIAQSGGAHGRNRHLRETWYGLEPMEQVGERIAAILGCDEADDVLAALRAVPAAKLLDASKPVRGLFGRGIKFGPVIDGWAILDDPADLWAAGKQHDVPFLTGANADEGSVFTRQLPIKRAVGYRLTVRMLFGDRADEVLRLFPVPANGDVREVVSRLVGVSSFVVQARFLARAMEKVDSPGYLYHFARAPQSGPAKAYGAFHGLEIGYVFGTLNSVFGPTPKDWALSKAMRGCWTRFARTGDPNGEGIPPWPAYEAAKDQYIEFGDTIAVKAGLWKQACDLFDELAAERRKTRDTTPVRRWPHRGPAGTRR